jgi:amino acid permease
MIKKVNHIQIKRILLVYICTETLQGILVTLEMPSIGSDVVYMKQNDDSRSSQSSPFIYKNYYKQNRRIYWFKI